MLDAQIGHRAENVPPGEDVEVVCSSAIAADNPERLAAVDRGLVVLTRAQLLAQLTALRRTIAVAGAHGKTTTAAMIVNALRGGGVEASYLIGGILLDSGRNGDWREGEWLVVEADESDRSLLALQVEIAVLTNVELDHHDAFASLHELEEVYREFLAGAPTAVIWDRPELLALRGEGALVTYDTPVAAAGAALRRWRSPAPTTPATRLPRWPWRRSWALTSPARPPAWRPSWARRVASSASGGAFRAPRSMTTTLTTRPRSRRRSPRRARSSRGA